MTPEQRDYLNRLHDFLRESAKELAWNRPLSNSNCITLGGQLHKAADGLASLLKKDSE